MTTPQAVYKIYQAVIDDVVNNVREAFIDEGVDEQVLQDLKQIWESKLLQTEAVDPNAPESQPQGHGQSQHREKGSSDSSSRNSGSNSRSQSQHHNPSSSHTHKAHHYDKKFEQQPPQPSQYSANLSSSATAATLALQQQVLQISQQGAALTLPQGQTFQVQSNVGYQVPLVIQHLGQGAPQLAQQIMLPQGSQSNMQPGIPINIAQRPDKSQKILQLDGANDSSDEDDDSDEVELNNDEEDDDDDDENENDEYSNAVDEEPLNSDDDVSDEDPTELFQADNVVVCQFDKISRTRNKWKFQLKQGIMNMKGKDNVFFKALGEADW